MFNKEGKLDIFENFRVDYTLHKYIQPIADTPITNMSELAERTMHRLVMSSRQGNVGIRINTGAVSDNVLVVEKPATIPWYRRLLRRAPKEPKPELTIEQFFQSVKNTAEELVVVKERALGYETAIKSAEMSGQKALFEKLMEALVATRSETQLIALSMPKYIEEASLVEFVKKAKKGLRLDWIANFMRIIPADLLEKKKAADERKIFDNYVVLHYDPEAKSWAETHEEKERRRDPILFGVIQGKRRLYYVGDWKDEFCDLTLDQVADTIGADKVHQLRRVIEV